MPETPPLQQEAFAKIKPPMTQGEALIEASRCLFCHDAPCIMACPTSIDIPMFIRQIASHNVTGSARTIFSQNILGKSCAYVCPTEVLCEGACVYHGMNEKPIEIGRLQAYATDSAIADGERFFEAGSSTGKKVAIIGSGPAGLACAHELTRLGHDVVVFEASPRAGGLNAYGVAPYKYANADAAQEVAYIQGIGFEIRTGCRVIPDEADNPNEKNTVSFSSLEAQYDAIFLAMGLGASRRLNLPGEDKANVYGAAEFIYQLREQNQKISIGREVLVVGAGNTAIDACVECAKLGAQVTLVYRRSETEQSAYDFEVALAKQHGVRFLYLASPLEILGEAAVSGLRCIRNQLIESANGNKPEIKPVAGTEFTLAADMVILATGQEKQTDFLENITGLTLTGGKIKVNDAFQTTNPQYFAGGDCVNGGKEVVNAAAHGRDAARGIDAFLSSGGAQ